MLSIPFCQEYQLKEFVFLGSHSALLSLTPLLDLFLDTALSTLNSHHSSLLHCFQHRYFQLRYFDLHCFHFSCLLHFFSSITHFSAVNDINFHYFHLIYSHLVIYLSIS